MKECRGKSNDILTEILIFKKKKILLNLRCSHLRHLRSISKSNINEKFNR